MPRIRTIKPEFWTDEKVVELDPWARLLFIGLWNFADDQGYIEHSPKRIKMQIFPGDTTDVVPLLASLLEAGLLAEFDSPIGRLLHIQSWTKHQKVSNAASPRVDPADLVLIHHSDDPPPEPSRALASPLSGKERKGKEEEGKGKEYSADAEPPPASRPAAPPSSTALFAEFWEIYPKREAKAAAQKAWTKATRRADPATIIAAAAAYRDLPDRDPRFTKNPATWLNADCWLDERPARASPGTDLALVRTAPQSTNEASVQGWLSMPMPSREAFG